MSSAARSWWTDLSCLIVLVGILYTLFLGMRPLMPPDEARYSEIPREMVATKDYLTPHLNGVKYFEKPALFYWLQCASIKLFGLNEWSLRFSTALMGLLGCVITYWGARQLYNRRTAILAAMMLSTTLLYWSLSQFVTLDMTLTVFLTASLLCFLVGNRSAPGVTRRYILWGFYLAAALATLTKGLVGVIFPGMIIFFWLCLTRQWRQLSSYSIFSGACIFLAVTVPWHLLVQLKNPEFFQFYFVEQHFLRYLTKYAGREQPIWFFPLVLTTGFFPWTGFLLTSVRYYFNLLKDPKRFSLETFLILWAVSIFLFYWLSHSQLSPYILPIFPPLAILTANYLNIFSARKTFGIQVGFLLAILLALLLSVAGIVYLSSYQPHALSVLLIITLAVLCLGTGVSAYIYRRQGAVNGVVALFISATLFLTLINFNLNAFDNPSVKPIAMKLKTILNTQDKVYNYQHYFQDLPVYLQRPVSLVNWQGELTFGSLHAPPAQAFLSEDQLWQEWPGSQRKFLLVKKDAYANISKHLPQLKFYPVAKTSSSILVSNQDVK